MVRQMNVGIALWGGLSGAELAICDTPFGISCDRSIQATALARIDLFDAVFSPTTTVHGSLVSGRLGNLDFPGRVLEAIAAARFDGIELFEADFINFNGSARDLRRQASAGN